LFRENPLPLLGEKRHVGFVTVPRNILFRAHSRV
jgi:hypothetical protein